MKLDINRDEIIHALSKIQGIVEKKGPLQAYANALLEAEPPDTLRISATDLEVNFSGQYRAQVSEAGSLAVAAKNVFEMVKALPAGMIQLTREDNNYLHLQNGSVHFRLVGMSGEEFPRFGSVDDADGFIVPIGLLSKMIDRVKFTVSNDDSRPTLNGLFVKPTEEENGLMMVSTDGHRLSKVVEVLDVPVIFSRPAGVIIPRKGFHELTRVFGHSKEAVFFGVSDNQAVFRTPTEMLSIRLIEGAFPDFSAVIPRQCQNRLSANRSNLIGALKRAMVVTDTKHTGCTVKMSEGSTSIEVSNPDVGQVREDLSVEYTGNPLEVGYNVAYLLECVSALAQDTVILELNNCSSPGIIKSTPEDESLYVVMPMRL